MLLRDITSLPVALQNGAVAIGNFDGVHRGHARIIQRLREMSDRVGGATVVFTFDPPPAALLRPDKAPPPLTTVARKAELLEALGVDAVIAYPTNMALLQLSPAEFFDEIIQRRLAARALVEGTNFYFGHDRAGTIDVLRAFAAKARMEMDVVEPLLVADEPVSSSRVRRQVAVGDVAMAGHLLTQPYRIVGTVTQGAGRGASLGFPTANLSGIETLLPAPGVYAGKACLTGVERSDGPWPAAINVGPNPTFGEDALKVEVHLIGFQSKLYGQTLAVDFLSRLRDIRPFESVDALKQQLTKDIEQVRNQK